MAVGRNCPSEVMYHEMQVLLIQCSSFHETNLHQQSLWEAKLVPERPWSLLIAEYGKPCQNKPICHSVFRNLFCHTEGRGCTKGPGTYCPSDPARSSMCIPISTSFLVTLRSNCSRASGLLRGREAEGRYLPYSTLGGAMGNLHRIQARSWPRSWRPLTLL